MKKISVFLLAIMIFAILVSCSSTATPVQVVKGAADKTIEDVDKSGRPAWVTRDISTKEVHYAAGYAKQSNLQNSIKRAQVEARNLLAEWVSTSIDEIVIAYTNDAGTDGNRQALDSFEAISKQRAQATISGSKQEAMWEDGDGGVWILLSIPTAAIADSAYVAFNDPAVQSTFETNEAAQKANEMMVSAIERYFGK